MTIIVGVVEDGTVYMGGDRAALDVNGYDLITNGDTKVFHNANNRDFIMGVSGSPRVKQVLRYKLGSEEFPLVSPTPEEDLQAYMSTTFVEAARAVLEAGGSKISEAGRESIESSFLVGIRGAMFQVFGDFYVQSPYYPYAAAGSGDNNALGVLFALEKTNVTMSPVDRVRLALEAAHEFNAGCRPPFDIVTTRPVLRERAGLTLVSPYQAIYA
jgi:hypothetical protein